MLAHEAIAPAQAEAMEGAEAEAQAQAEAMRDRLRAARVAGRRQQWMSQGPLLLASALALAPGSYFYLASAVSGAREDGILHSDNVRAASIFNLSILATYVAFVAYLMVILPNSRRAMQGAYCFILVAAVTELFVSKTALRVGSAACRACSAREADASLCLRTVVLRMAHRALLVPPALLALVHSLRMECQLQKHCPLLALIHSLRHSLCISSSPPPVRLPSSGARIALLRFVRLQATYVGVVGVALIFASLVLIRTWGPGEVAFFIRQLLQIVLVNTLATDSATRRVRALPPCDTGHSLHRVTPAT
jgi:hypothetical protein